MRMPLIERIRVAIRTHRVASMTPPSTHSSRRSWSSHLEIDWLKSSLSWQMSWTYPITFCLPCRSVVLAVSKVQANASTSESQLRLLRLSKLRRLSRPKRYKLIQSWSLCKSWTRPRTTGLLQSQILCLTTEGSLLRWVRISLAEISSVAITRVAENLPVEQWQARFCLVEEINGYLFKIQINKQISRTLPYIFRDLKKSKKTTLMAQMQQ